MTIVHESREPAAEAEPPVEPTIIREPRVYLVGRQRMDRAEIDRFLEDYGMTWETDTEVGGEQLVEASGRVCYLSFGKGRKTKTSNRFRLAPFC